jgi:hypothetical protein
VEAEWEIWVAKKSVVDLRIASNCRLMIDEWAGDNVTSEDILLPTDTYSD